MGTAAVATASLLRPVACSMNVNAAPAVTVCSVAPCFPQHSPQQARTRPFAKTFSTPHQEDHECRRKKKGTGRAQ